MSNLPRYPIFIPSKGRWESSLTVKMLQRDGIPFRVVIEEPEYDQYATVVDEKYLLVLPFVNQGLHNTRRWIKEYSIEQGHDRHWQLDDNIRTARRVYKGKRIYCHAGIALKVCEEFTDRYTNIAISGLEYTFFMTGNPRPPFTLNTRVYSSSLINNHMPFVWRRIFNDDTDICLQALASGEWCTVLINAFTMDKMATMTVKGGNFKDLYQYQDGRLKMARSLERDWPGVVETRRRFQRPQHVVHNSWRDFDTPLIRRPDLDLSEGNNEYGMKLNVKPELKSDRLRKLADDFNQSSM